MTRYEHGKKVSDVVHPGGVQGRLVSTSTSDTSDGTGIQKIKMDYFTSDWTFKTEVLTLNGTTPVDTVDTDIYRVESFSAIKTGSNNIAAGIITLKNIAGTNLFAQIDAYTLSFRRSLHYVKRGYVGYVENVVFSSTSTGGVAFDLIMTKDFNSDGGGFVVFPYLSVEIKENAEYYTPSKLMMIDASDSSRALAVAVCVRGLSVSQRATASFEYKDYHIKDI